MIYRSLAEFVIVLHFCFVLFVVFGGLLAVRGRKFILLHLPALLWGVSVELFNWKCPLTLLENWFRQLGGEAGYRTGFIEHYISAILYAPISREFQAMLGVLLLGINLLIYSFVFLRRRFE